MADWELKKIKKIYGENFMKLCRELFPIILEQDGKLYEIITSSFSTNSKTLYDDIIDNNMVDEFKNLVFSKIDVENSKEETVEKTPYEILDEAGYILTECKTEGQIQKFKKYYEPDEELCTFWGGRLERCVVFWAVKKDVDDIKREEYENPKREDEYGTSVMSIQFSKKGLCTVSIKNRYNHRVNNPDATYGNNLNNIAPGLEQSFANLLKERGLKLNSKNIITDFELPGYVEANDGKYYKYNMEIDGIYYCPGNIVITDGKVYELGNPEQEILIDYFVLNLKDKTIKTYDDYIDDSFPDTIQNMKRINVEKAKDGVRIIQIETEKNENPIIIKIDKDNQIIGYKNEIIKELNYNSSLLTMESNKPFLRFSRGLEEIDLPNLTSVGDEFLISSRNLTDVKFPNLETVGNEFLRNARKLKKINLPKLKKAGKSFLKNSNKLTDVNFPELLDAGDYFLSNATELEIINLPNLQCAGDFFIYNSDNLKKIELPQIKRFGNAALRMARKLDELNLPYLEEVGNDFLHTNEILAKLNAPKLRKVGNRFLETNMSLRELNLPDLTETGYAFMTQNTDLETLEVPSLWKIGDFFLISNKKLQKLNLPNTEKIGRDFLESNSILEELNAPNLKEMGKGFLENNASLREKIELELSNRVNDEQKDSNKSNLELKNLEEIMKDMLSNKLKEQNITAEDIARLDRKNQIRSSEIEYVTRLLENMRNQDLENSKE